MFTVPKFLIFITLLCISRLSIAKLVIKPEELKALEKFKPLVKQFVTHGYQTTDSYLVRWLKAKKLNVDDAVELFKEAQEWRRENNIDSILSENYTDIALQYRSDGVDYEGRTVYTSSIADFNVRKIVLSGIQERHLRYTLQDIERAASKAAEAVYKSNGTLTDSRLVSITDVHGFSTRKHACLACIQYYTSLTRVVEKHYPGISGLDISINTPRIALPVYQLISSFLSPESKESLKVFGSDRTEWTEYLDTIIAPDQRTRQFGGTKKSKTAKQ